MRKEGRENFRKKRNTVGDRMLQMRTVFMVAARKNQARPGLRNFLGKL